MEKLAISFNLKEEIEEDIKGIDEESKGLDLKEKSILIKLRNIQRSLDNLKGKTRYDCIKYEYSERESLAKKLNVRYVGISVNGLRKVINFTKEKGTESYLIDETEKRLDDNDPRNFEYMVYERCELFGTDFILEDNKNFEGQRLKVFAKFTNDLAPASLKSLEETKKSKEKQKSKKKYFFINKEGREHEFASGLKNDFEGIKPFFDGRAWVKQKGKMFKSSYWTLIDETGELIIEGKYKKVKDFSGGGYWVKDFKGAWCLLDINGEIIFKKNLKKVYGFSEGLAFVEDNDGFFKCIDKKGEIVFVLGNEYDKKRIYNLGKFNNGLAKIGLVDQGGNVSVIYINKEGKSVLSKKENILYGEDFYNGVAFVKYDNLGFNLINKEEEVLSNLIFDRVGKFHDSWAVVKHIFENSYNLINTNGEFISDNDFYDILKSFIGDGVAIVEKEKINGEYSSDEDLNNNIVFFNVYGEEVFKP